MNKFWSILFLLVPIIGVALFLFALDDQNWPLLNYWFPDDVSEYGHIIDGLFMVILWLTGVVFVATELALVWFLWRYDGKTNRDPVKFTHGSHSLEVVWTVLPAATLLFIAIYQMNAWADTKIRRPENPDFEVEITARRFEWRIRYPGPNGKFDEVGELHPDDIYDVNDLHVPVDATVLVHLKSKDVLHSFFLPNLRVKQDAVPGMKIPVWFKARQTGEFDLVCAGLCGRRHYQVSGRPTVQTRDELDAHLKKLLDDQRATQSTQITTESEE